MSLGKRSLEQMEAEWFLIKEEEDRLMKLPVKNDVDIKKKRKLVMENKAKMVLVENLISNQEPSSKKCSVKKSEAKILHQDWDSAKKEEDRIFKIITNTGAELEQKKNLAKESKKKIEIIENKILATDKENFE